LLPELDDDDDLSEGIHRARLVEFERRFRSKPVGVVEVLF